MQLGDKLGDKSVAPQEQQLPTVGNKPTSMTREHDADLLREAHFQEAVSLVQDQRLQVLQPHRLRVPQVVNDAALKHGNEQVKLIQAGNPISALGAKVTASLENGRSRRLGSLGKSWVHVTGVQRAVSCNKCATVRSFHVSSLLHSSSNTAGWTYPAMVG